MSVEFGKNMKGLSFNKPSPQICPRKSLPCVRLFGFPLINIYVAVPIRPAFKNKKIIRK